MLERVQVKSVTPNGTLRVATVCDPEDIGFELYEENPWRPQAVLLEVRPSANSCFVDDELTAELIIDGVSVGTAAIPIRATLGPVAFRAPFIWQGGCAPEEVVVWVRMAGAVAELRPTARPLCDPQASSEWFAAGWP